MAQKCPKCENGDLEYNDEWDKAFDRLDSTRPSFDIIYRELAADGIPKFICSSCDYKKIVYSYDQD